MAVAIILWQAQGGGGSLLGLVAPFIAIFLVFYFLLILPNKKRQKEQQQMLANLKNGDRVITSGGLHGTIIGMKDEYIHLRVPPEQVKLEVLRSSVATVQAPPGEQK